MEYVAKYFGLTCNFLANIILFLFLINNKDFNQIILNLAR